MTTMAFSSMVSFERLLMGIGFSPLTRPRGNSLLKSPNHQRGTSIKRSRLPGKLFLANGPK
jgi:hypothetical protein